MRVNETTAARRPAPGAEAGALRRDAPAGARGEALAARSAPPGRATVRGRSELRKGPRDRRGVARPARRRRATRSGASRPPCRRHRARCGPTSRRCRRSRRVVAGAARCDRRGAPPRWRAARAVVRPLARRRAAARSGRASRSCSGPSRASSAPPRPSSRASSRRCGCAGVGVARAGVLARAGGAGARVDGPGVAPLETLRGTAPSPSGKAKVCKTFIPRFESGRCLQPLLSPGDSRRSAAAVTVRPRAAALRRGCAREEVRRHLDALGRTRRTRVSPGSVVGREHRRLVGLCAVSDRLAGPSARRACGPRPPCASWDPAVPRGASRRGRYSGRALVQA